MLLQVGNQRFTVRLALLRLTQTVDFKAPLGQAQALPQRHGQQDQLGIHIGTGKAHGFCTDLVELAIAAALRALVAEHGADVPHAFAAVVQQVVFNGGAHQAGRAFGAQRQALAVELVFKGVHLLFHNIGHLANAAHKQLRVLHDGRAHIAVGKAAHQVAHLRLQPFPACRFAGKDVIHAFDGGKFVGLSH